MTYETAITGPRPTTLIQSARLSTALGADVTIASETFQWTGSFKFRAAYNLARSVKQDEIITASSGNFGQAMAFACKLLGKRCTVVMPANSVSVKVDAVRAFGATADLVDTKVTPRHVRVGQLAEKSPDAYVASAYDDQFVIAGNASLAHELAAVTPAFDVIVSPIGGGGLSSGIILGLREKNSETKVIAAEPLMANDAARSFREGHIVKSEFEPQTIADGARTLSVGIHNWELLKDGLEDVIEVPEKKITDAVRMLFLLANLKVEPTGALATGALLTAPERFSGQRVCVVVSGGNADPDLYTRIIAGEL
jgi:threonine dehydratase